MTPKTESVPGKLTHTIYGILFALVGVIVILGLAQFIDKMMARRLMSIVLGLIMVTSGNFLPKLVHPIQPPSKTGRIQRTIGWILVLSGAGLVVALTVLPDAFVAIWTAIIGLSGLILSATLIIGARLGDRHLDIGIAESSDHDIEAANRNASIRNSTFHILHGIVWVFVVFVAEMIWGTDALKWTLIAFAVSMTVFPASLKNRVVNPLNRGDGC